MAQASLLSSGVAALTATVATATTSCRSPVVAPSGVHLGLAPLEKYAPLTFGSNFNGAKLKTRHSSQSSRAPRGKNASRLRVSADLLADSEPQLDSVTTQALGLEASSQLPISPSVTSDIPSPEVELRVPSPTPSLPSVDTTIAAPSAESATISNPGVVEAAGQSGANVLNTAGETVITSEPSAPLSLTQRYEALINDKKAVSAPEPSASQSLSKRYEDLINGTKSGVTSPTKKVDSEDILSSVTDTLASAQDSITKAFADIQSAVKDLVESAGSVVTRAYDNLNGSVKGSINNVTGLYDKTVGDIQTSVDSSVSKAGGEVADYTSVFRTGTPLNNQLKEVVVVVKGATGQVVEGAGKVVMEIYGATTALLPPELQAYLSTAEQKVQEVSGPLRYLLEQAYGGIENFERAVGVDPDNPIIPVILVVGGTFYVGVSYWQARYGGYSGDLMPSSAIELIKKEGNVVLVDIRPQALRESQGIPDLRRRARSRSAAVEAIKVDGSLRSMLKNAKDIDSILTAAVIRDLKSVKRDTKVIVMDADGSQSKEVARALRKFGINRRYRIDGGFKAWTAAGVRTKSEGADSPIEILKEDAEEIVEEVKPTSDGVVLVALGLIAGIYAAFEWEKSLQLIGVIGLSQGIYSRVKNYETVEDVQEDFRILLRPFRFVGEKILWAVGQVEPSTLQLATSPSTSAMQDRVLQAAAKHGPLASESEPEQTEEVKNLGAEKVGEAMAETEVETLSSLSIQEPLHVQSSLDGIPAPPPSPPPPAAE